MKTILFVFGAFMLLSFTSCSNRIDTGVLLSKAEMHELSSAEREDDLFENDEYWKVETQSGDTINGVLPDWVEKMAGDPVDVYTEGRGFITLE